MHDAARLLYSQALNRLEESAPLDIAIVQAEPAGELARIRGHATTLLLTQRFRPEWRQLSAQKFSPSPALSGMFDLILLLPGKQRERSLADMADAMLHLNEGGALLVCCPNEMGARSYEKHLAQLAGNIESMSKHHCRCFSAVKDGEFNTALAGEWIEAGAARVVPELGLTSQPGIFSWNHLDDGSALLLDNLPTLAGNGMDLCCGNGVLAQRLLAANDKVGTLHLVDADALAIAAAQANLGSRGQYHWLDATSEPLPGNLDWIVLNPPFHAGLHADIELGRSIVTAACAALNKGGELHMVANRKLPYEAELTAGLSRWQVVIEARGYKVVRGVR